MLERCRELDLAAESVGAQRGGEIRRQHLDHDLPAEGGLLGQEDAAHATAAQLALEQVAPGKGGTEVLENVGQPELVTGYPLGYCRGGRAAKGREERRERRERREQRERRNGGAATRSGKPLFLALDPPRTPCDGADGYVVER
jgi:hypothetical protein